MPRNPLLKDSFAGPLPQPGIVHFWEGLREKVELLRVRAADHAEELARCAADTSYWMDTYCHTYDPRTAGKAMPFKLWPRQVAFLKWLGQRKAEGVHQAGQKSPVALTSVVEKSRGVGVTFLCAGDALHDFLFVPGYKAGFGSRKLEFVDTLGDLDSIFEKIRFMMRRLPAWMLPSGWDERKHDNHKRLLNPETGAAITGEGGDEIGRGGRTSLYFVDEAAHLDHPDRVDSALSENTNVCIWVSTPNGPGNTFARKRFSLPPERVFSFHWKDDPRKDDAWATATKAEKGAVIFASQYDIDYSASIEGICIPGAWVRAAVNLKLPPRTDDKTGTVTEYVKGEGRCVAGFDIAEEGDNLSVLIPRWGPVVGKPQSRSKSDTTQTAWWGRDRAMGLGAEEVFYDVIGVGAGIKGTWNNSDVPLTFRAVPVNVGDHPTERLWPDKQTSKEKFANLKAELWWTLRLRFERTYEWVAHGIEHPADEMISIPDDPRLIADLSLPLAQPTETGKIRIESKDSLRRRGVKSPDFAEALVLSEAAWVLARKQLWWK